MNTDLMFSSASDEWETPQDLFDRLDAKYRFTLDVCATAENAKCENYYDRAMDGLKRPWYGNVWCNPPYGRGIGAWVEKAYSTFQGAGKGRCVMLLPARTDTAWWHDYAMRGSVQFIRGRLKFGGHKNSAPFPSAIVVFG